MLDLDLEGLAAMNSSPSPLIAIFLLCHRMGKKTALKNGEWKTPGVKIVGIKVK